jgi:hypothetical protein
VSSPTGGTGSRPAGAAAANDEPPTSAHWPPPPAGSSQPSGRDPVQRRRERAVRRQPPPPLFPARRPGGAVERAPKPATPLTLSTSRSSASRAINRPPPHRATTAPRPHRRTDDPLTTRPPTRVRPRQPLYNRPPSVADSHRTDVYCAADLEQTMTPFRGHRRRAPDLLHLTRTTATPISRTRSIPRRKPHLTWTNSGGGVLVQEWS